MNINKAMQPSLSPVLEQMDTDERGTSTPCPRSPYSPEWLRGNDHTQNMIDSPWEVCEVSAVAESEIRSRHGLSDDDQTPRAMGIVSKSLRNIAMAATERLVGDRLHQLILPSVRHDHSLAVPDESVRHNQVLQSDRAGYGFVPGTTTYTFAASVHEWSMTAFQLIRDEAARDPGHPYNSLFAETERWHNTYAQAYLAYHGKPIGLEDAKQFVELPRVETTSIIARTLLCAGLSADLHTVGQTTGHELASYIARRLPKIAEIATINEQMLDRTVPMDVAKVLQAHETAGDQAEVLQAYATNFLPDGWSHPSLSKRGKPWPKPQCIAVRPTRSADAAARERTEELFAITEQRYGVEIERSGDGACGQIIPYLGFLGLNIAAHTVFDRWQSIHPLTNR